MGLNFKTNVFIFLYKMLADGHKCHMSKFKADLMLNCLTTQPLQG